MTRVSVLIPVYNHEAFVAEAVESVLAQRGDFSLEVFIGDDASSDASAAVARSFGERLPEVVKVLPPCEHLGMTRNFERCFRAATGDYISVCEGDDYWPRADELALEIDFLHRHEECALCPSAVAYRDEGTRAEHKHPSQESFAEPERTFTTRDLIASNFMAIFGTYRGRVVRGLPPTLFDLNVADWVFNIACSRAGLIGFVNALGYVIRIHGANDDSFFPWAPTGDKREVQMQKALAQITSYDRFFDHEFHAEFENLRRFLTAHLASFSAPK